MRIKHHVLRFASLVLSCYMSSLSYAEQLSNIKNEPAPKMPQYRQELDLKLDGVFDIYDVVMAGQKVGASGEGIETLQQIADNFGAVAKPEEVKFRGFDSVQQLLDALGSDDTAFSLVIDALGEMPLPVTKALMDIINNSKESIIRKVHAIWILGMQAGWAVKGYSGDADYARELVSFLKQIAEGKNTNVTNADLIATAITEVLKVEKNTNYLFHLFDTVSTNENSSQSQKRHFKEIIAVHIMFHSSAYGRENPEGYNVPISTFPSITAWPPSKYGIYLKTKGIPSEVSIDVNLGIDQETRDALKNRGISSYGIKILVAEDPSKTGKGYSIYQRVATVEGISLETQSLRISTTGPEGGTLLIQILPEISGE